MKKLQNKILLIFFIIGTIIIIGMGAFFAGIIGENQEFIGASEYVTSQDLINITDAQMNQAKILILGTILVFSCIVFLISLYITKTIVKPINSMLTNAKRVANGENVELVRVNSKKKKKRRKKKKQRSSGRKSFRCSRVLQWGQRKRVMKRLYI